VPTWVFMAAVTAALIGIDVCLIITFGLGLLAGHWFW
jgi:hypothetical protein